MRKLSVVTVGAVVGAMLLTACGDDQGNEAGAGSATGSRTIEVSMRDDLTFEPSSLAVDVGETVTFVVTNEGEIVHDFSLGDMAHDTEHMEGALVLEPGQTGEMSFTFEEPGTVEFACHQPGHLEAGMVLTATAS